MAKREASRPLNRRRQDVASATNRLDKLRVAAIILQLAPQPADCNVDRPVEWSRLTAAQKVKEHVPR